jgi:hypothetical protein
LTYLPIGVAIIARHPPTIAALSCAIAAGILSSAVPFMADLFALRHVPAQAFGLFMSINPMMAALIGAIMLRQEPGWIEWASIGAIVAANAISILTQRSEPAATSRAQLSAPAADTSRDSAKIVRSVIDENTITVQGTSELVDVTIGWAGDLQ